VPLSSLISVLIRAFNWRVGVDDGDWQHRRIEQVSGFKGLHGRYRQPIAVANFT